MTLWMGPKQNCRTALLCLSTGSPTPLTFHLVQNTFTLKGLPMPLTPSTKLGAYQILKSIGAGGMGEVYKAKDTRLDRTVAARVTT